MQTIKILTILGSLKRRSSQAAIIDACAALAPANVEFNALNGIENLPHFNPDLDTDQPPAKVASFRSQIREADAVIICTPEYAFGVPGSLKNVLDWTVSSGEFVDKPVAVITASSVGKTGHAALLTILGAVSANLPDDAQLLIPFIRSKVSNEGNVTDADVILAMQKVLNALLQAI